MRKIIVAILIATLGVSTAFAEQLKITVDVEATNKTTEIVGADIYANINGKLTEIAVTPDGDVPFKLNLKGGAFRLKSFWITRNQINGKEEKETLKVEKDK